MLHMWNGDEKGGEEMERMMVAVVVIFFLLLMMMRIDGGEGMMMIEIARQDKRWSSTGVLHCDTGYLALRKDGLEKECWRWWWCMI